MPNRPRQLIERARQSSWKVTRAAKLEVYAYWRSKPINETTVLYESFAGNGVLDNPEAIFRGLRRDPAFASFTHIWVLRSSTENPEIVREFAGDSSVRFVEPGSSGYYRALATSRYLINNATFPSEFSKRDGQIYLNTWHGTPLKRMGFDIDDAAARTANVIRNFLSTDYVLSMNPFMTKQLYETAHRMRGIYQGRVIEEGYPRIDAQFAGAAADARTRRRLEASGIVIGDRQVILYAPTWKGSSFGDPTDDARELIKRVHDLEAAIDPEHYVVLLKTHQVVHQFAAERPEFAGTLVPNEVPTNAVLAITDVLITDYSSIFFDFLTTGRPIVHLTPDIEDYEGYRGLYQVPGDWPGPVVTTLPELATEVNSIIRSGLPADVARRYEEARERYVPDEDGGATERVIDIVFRGKQEGYSIEPLASEGRETILINVGGMRPNAVTTAALNLLDGIDYERFDVSVVFPWSRRQSVLEQQAFIPPPVRQFARVGTLNGSQFSQLRRRFSWARGISPDHSSASQERLWRDEWRRCFGLSTFDYVVDFSGYGRLWSRLLLYAPGARRSIWLHEDLAADVRLAADDDAERLRELRAVFSTYREYDSLVSVSAKVAAENAEGLAQYADRDRFVWAPSLVNADRVLESGKAPSPMEREPDTTLFVTVGRLSADRDHAGLIRAFARVHAEAPETRLVIVGGGPLGTELRELSRSLGLADAIRFLGHRRNPYATMAIADCFVLASEDDRERTIFFDAAILGLPVVSPDGLAAYLHGDVQAQPFSADDYNAGAIAAFYTAIGASPDSLPRRPR